MGKRCGSRDWTKEEMMAYLDWNTAEDRRVQDRVDAIVERDGVFNNRRGLTDLWKMIDEDSEEQLEVV